MNRSDRKVISHWLEKQKKTILRVDKLIDQIEKSFLLRSYSRRGKYMG